jgi:hypothetical protein
MAAVLVLLHLASATTTIFVALTYGNNKLGVATKNCNTLVWW